MVCFLKSVQVDTRRYLSSIMHMVMVEHLGSYLGLPSSFNRSKSKDFKGILDRVWGSLQGWKMNFFPCGGKEILIKCAIQAIPTYAMGCFKLPRVLLSKIASLCARFRWGSADSKKRIHWKQWRELCKPKEMGGLNFRDLELFNQAMLAKQDWRMLSNPGSTVAQVLKGKY